MKITFIKEDVTLDHIRFRDYLRQMIQISIVDEIHQDAAMSYKYDKRSITIHEDSNKVE